MLRLVPARVDDRIAPWVGLFPRQSRSKLLLARRLLAEGLPQQPLEPVSGDAREPRPQVTA